MQNDIWSSFLESALEQKLITFDKPDFGFQFEAPGYQPFYVPLIPKKNAKQPLWRVILHAAKISYICMGERYSQGKDYGYVIGYFISLESETSSLGSIPQVKSGIIEWKSKIDGQATTLMSYLETQGIKNILEKTYVKTIK